MKILKQWIVEEANKRGISTRAMWLRYYRKKFSKPPLKRVNARVIFVIE